MSGNKLQQIEASFSNGVISIAHEFVAAWLLIFDSWLYVMNVYDSPDNSPFVGLVTLTRNSTAPALKLAHAIREHAFGDHAQTYYLSSMLQSLDSTLQEVGIALPERYPVKRASKKASKKSRKM